MIKRNFIFILLLVAFSSFIFIDNVTFLNAGVKEDCQKTYNKCVQDCIATAKKNLKFNLNACKNSCKKRYEDCVKKSARKKFGF